MQRSPEAFTIRAQSGREGLRIVAPYSFDQVDLLGLDGRILPWPVAMKRNCIMHRQARPRLDIA